MDRKLAVIVAADVVGYSTLMERDEAGTFNRLRESRKELFEPEIQKHHGRIFKLMGDGLLAEFGSVVGAVECAVSLQRGLAERNANVPEDERIEVRIGINLGEVIVDGDDRYGEGVNVAARLQQLADPGGICVSGKVAKEVEKKLAFGFESMGDLQVKNIAEPVPAYRVQLAGAPAKARTKAVHKPTARRMAFAGAVVVIVIAAIGLGFWLMHSPKPATTGRPTLAVLPLANMSGDPSFQYFADGATEDLIAGLSRSPALKVIARTSSDAYKGKSVDIRQISQELGARYVLEGSVQKSDTKVRIVAQLIDGTSGDHVWADRFDREGSDPLALQDAVTEKIIETISGDAGLIKKHEYEAAWGKNKSDLGEYDYYLRGHDLFMRVTAQDNQEAMRIWKEGLAKYPNSSLLKIKIGTAYDTLASLWSEDPASDYAAAERSVREGLAGDPPAFAKGVAHWVLADVAINLRGDFEGALKERGIALQLLPGDPAPRIATAYIPVASGDPDTTIASLSDLSPEVPWALVGYASLSWAYFAKKDYEKAIEAAKASPVATPTFSMLFLAASYAKLGRTGDAQKVAKDILAAAPWATVKIFRTSFRMRDQEVFDRWAAALRTAGVPEG